MAGYTRQSSFVDGDTITAALFNDEYNQLVNVFSNTSGHKHDGTAAEGPVIGLIGDAGETSPNNKVLIDTTNNYIEFYVEVSSAPVQQLYIADGAIVPVTDNDIDLGTSSLEFKNLYLDGTAKIDTLTVDEAATVGTTLGVTGATTLSSTLGVTGATTLSSTLAVTGATTLSSTLAVTGTSTLTGNVTTTNNLSVGGNLTVTGNATISGNLTFGDADTDSITLTADVASHITPDVDNTYDLGTSTKEWRNLYIDGTANIDSLVADTADINAGTVDNTVIGGTTAVAGSFTTATATTGNITTVNATTVDTTNIEVTNLKAKDGTSAGSIANTTGVVTLASSVLTTTDINGGTIDGVTIGGTSAGAVTFTDLSDGTITITAFVDEDNMASNSATLVPTQQSVKAYVDSQVTAQDLDFQGDTGGALSIDLDSETLTIAGGTGIDTVGATNTLTVSIDSTVATLTGTQTLTNKTLTAPVISSIVNTGTLTLPTSTDTLVGRATTDTLTNKTLTSPTINTATVSGGTIDNAVIGGSTPAAADFTTMDTTGNASVGGNLTVTGDLTINGTTTTVNSTTVTIDDPIFTLGGDTAPSVDDNKDRGIEFRWHNGTAAKVGFFGYDDSASVFTFIPDATNTSEVFSGSAGNVAFGNIAGTLTTAAQPNITSLGTLTGLDVAGTPTFDGLTVEQSTSPTITINDTDSVSPLTIKQDGANASMLLGSAGVLTLGVTNNSGLDTVILQTQSKSRLNIASNGDISFYEDTGTTAKLFWDASAESLGIGTSSPTNVKLQINESLSGTAGTGHLAFGEASTPLWNWRLNTTTADLILDRSYSGWQSTPVISFDRSTGNVGIGTTSPADFLDISANGTSVMRLSDSSSPATYAKFTQANGVLTFAADVGNAQTGSNIQFEVDGSEHMRIDSSGNVMVGKTAVGVGTAGIELRANNMAAVSRASDNVLYLNRITNDGSILELRKDNVVVGNIGAATGTTYIDGGSTYAGLQFGGDGGSEGRVVPRRNGSLADGQTTLGTASYRFKELYLSGVAKVDSSAYISQQALTSSSGSVAWDAAAKANAYYATTENTTFAAPTNAVEGAIISVEIAQGATAYTVAWNTVFEFAASTAPTVTATANKTDIFTFRYNGSVWQEIGRTQNLAQT